MDEDRVKAEERVGTVERSKYRRGLGTELSGSSLWMRQENELGVEDIGTSCGCRVCVYGGRSLPRLASGRTGQPLGEEFLSELTRCLSKGLSGDVPSLVHWGKSQGGG